MFKEHNFAVWGSNCTCGQECFILQNKFHPWIEKEFIIKIKCPSCGREQEIDGDKASEFYSRKILRYYRNIEGSVIDLGCGGGFLAEFLAKEEKVHKIYAVDNDISCREEIEGVDCGKGKISFIHMDVCNLDKQFNQSEIDFLVSRDVFMFIDNTEKYFNDVTAIVKKGIRQMGWYAANNERMKNHLHPDQIVEELAKRNWKVNIEYLDWYKCGYFIEAIK